jgi:hypothetical protein
VKNRKYGPLSAKKSRSLEHLALHLRSILWYRRREPVSHRDPVPCIDRSDGCCQRCQLALIQIVSSHPGNSRPLCPRRYASQCLCPSESCSLARGEEISSYHTATRSSFVCERLALRAALRWYWTQKAQPLICDALDLDQLNQRPCPVQNRLPLC